jgi:catechol 2,3-dioxygenase
MEVSTVSTASVTGLRSVEFAVTDLDRSLRFYEDVWQLEPVERETNAVFLRGSGDEHHIVILRKADTPGLLSASFSAPDRLIVDTLFERVSRCGGAPFAAPRALDLPGDGYGFSFLDLEARRFAISSDVRRHTVSRTAENRPSKLSHLVLNVPSIEPVTRFFADVLGFRLRDQTARMHFLGCNPDHHSVALAHAAGISVNHVAFEVPDLDSLMRGSARVKRAGTPLEWGIGRHGPGNNIFAYFCDPDELVIEYTAAVEQVDDRTYRCGGPSDWKPPIPGNPDYCGFTVRALLTGNDAARPPRAFRAVISSMSAIEPRGSHLDFSI